MKAQFDMVFPNCNENRVYNTDFPIHIKGIKTLCIDFPIHVKDNITVKP